LAIASKYKGLVQTEIGLLPEQWKVDKLENHLIIKGRIGWKGLAVSEYTEEGPFIVGGLQIENNGVTWKECAHVTEERYKESPEIMLKEQDILMTKDGTIGKLAYIDWLPSKATVASHIHVIRKNSEEILPKFLFYFFKSPIFQSIIESKTSGSVVPALIQRDINSIFIPIPPLAEQDAIAQVLSNLGSKILLNQHMNRTLEAIGQAVFKRWFLDFEFPNEEGKPYKSSGGEMDSSDFGEKPRGWSTKRFSEVIAVNPPRKIEKDAIAKKVEMSDLNPWQPWVESWNTDNYESGSRFQNGDTLFARITPCLENGKTALVSFLSENEVAFGSTEFIVLGPKTILSSYYILYLAVSKELRASAILSMNGSSGRQRVPNDFFGDFVVSVPPNELLRKFDDLVAPMFEKITNNTRESRSLKAFRDNLLPKLMSGKLRVPLEKEKVEEH
jgi:type I restriction enzyme S subunit